jgi:hypothetical protein
MRTMLVVALVGLVACQPPAPYRPPLIGPRTPGDDRQMPAANTSRGATNLATKKVDAKENPNVLVAVDATRCTVSEKKYREVSLGESVTCLWTNP